MAGSRGITLVRVGAGLAHAVVRRDVRTLSHVCGEGGLVWAGLDENHVDAEGRDLGGDARAWESPSTAHLLEWYAPKLAKARTPASELTCRMRPEP